MPLIIIIAISYCIQHYSHSTKKKTETNELNEFQYTFKQILFHQLTLIDACKINWQILFLYNILCLCVCACVRAIFFIFKVSLALNRLTAFFVVQYSFIHVCWSKLKLFIIIVVIRRQGSSLSLALLLCSFILFGLTFKIVLNS